MTIRKQASEEETDCIISVVASRALALEAGVKDPAV